MATRAKRGSTSKKSPKRPRGSRRRSEARADKARADEPRKGEREGGAGREGPRSFWSGTISFGLVNVPVRLMSATRTQRVARRRLGPDDQPLSREYYCPADDTALETDQILRGYELSTGEMVPLEDDELEGLEPDKSREIELQRFVPRADLPPQYFERAYFLVPGGEATRAYHLLARVMEDGDRAGIATFVMRGKEHLVAILADKGVLRAELLRFADELRSLDDVGIEPDPEAKVDGKLVRELRGELEALWHDELPTEMLDSESQRRLRELVERKRDRGEDVVASPETAGEGADARDNVVDLMSYLERSLDAKVSPAKAASGSNGKSGRKPARPSPKLDELTKSELYQRAQARNIEGRSSMTKAQLIAALTQNG